MLWGWAYTLQAAAAAGPGRGRWLCSAFPRLADAGGGPHRCRNRSFGQPAGDITRCRLRARLGQVRLQAGTGDAPLLCTVSRHGCPHCGASEVRREVCWELPVPHALPSGRQGPRLCARGSLICKCLTSMPLIQRSAVRATHVGSISGSTWSSTAPARVHGPAGD